VVENRPFLIRESTIGTGGASGAIYILRGFEELVRSRFRQVGIAQIEDKTIRGIVEQFRDRIMHHFDGLDPQAEAEFDLPIPGVHEMPAIGIRDGFMTFSK
jgi:hypothetical protein